MAKLSTSREFDRRHVSLSARLAGVAGSLHIAEDILLCDASEIGAVAKDVRGPRTLFIRHDGDAPTVGAAGAASATQLGVIAYDAGQPDMALACVLARIGALDTGSAPVGADPESLTVYALAERLASTEVPVLITGPTGAGKEVLARFIHRSSTRANAPFIGINCAAIPETMLEAMLFGHQKGAFTGANAASQGFFREADGGTLLLDEIAEMPLALQAKLLRALQEGEVTPVGSTRPVKVDVRIVACANRCLPDEVAAGRFREDLFYRLNVFPIHLPALCERPGDIAPLAVSMLLRHRGERQAPGWIGPAALAMLEQHNWPGNVRELENVIRRALVLAGDAREIEHAHIVIDKPVQTAVSAAREVLDNVYPIEQAGNGKLENAVRDTEARTILTMLRKCNGKRIEAARRLGISERTLRYRLASYREAGVPMEVAL